MLTLLETRKQIAVILINQLFAAGIDLLRSVPQSNLVQLKRSTLSSRAKGIIHTSKTRVAFKFQLFESLSELCVEALQAKDPIKLSSHLVSFPTAFELHNEEFPQCSPSQEAMLVIHQQSQNLFLDRGWFRFSVVCVWRVVRRLNPASVGVLFTDKNFLVPSRNKPWLSQ